jgi:hypothetical protein
MKGQGHCQYRGSQEKARTQIAPRSLPGKSQGELHQLTVDDRCYQPDGQSFREVHGVSPNRFPLEFEAPFVHRKELEKQVPSNHEIGNEGQKTTARPKTISRRGRKIPFYICENR